jgi:UDP-N-acetyl-D-mannosaminuronate dehydrogenase
MFLEQFPGEGRQNGWIEVICGSMFSGKTEESILVAFCPERTVEGDAVKELQELPQIIGANNEEAKNRQDRIEAIC